MLEVHSDAPGRLSLHGHCGLAQATLLAQALAQAHDQDGVVTIDVSGLDDLDTAGLQVLLAFARHRGGGAQLQGWSPALAARLRLTGFAELL